MIRLPEENESNTNRSNMVLETMERKSSMRQCCSHFPQLRTKLRPHAIILIFYCCCLILQSSISFVTTATAFSPSKFLPLLPRHRIVVPASSYYFPSFQKHVEKDGDEYLHNRFVGTLPTRYVTRSNKMTLLRLLQNPALQQGSNRIDAQEKKAETQEVKLRGEGTGKQTDDDRDDDHRGRIRNVSFESPLLDYGYPPAVEGYENGSNAEKPLLLYLPGFDGTYICPFMQFPELSVDFDVRCMTIGMDDRSTFEELKSDVIEFLRELEEEMSSSGTAGATLNNSKQKRKRQESKDDASTAKATKEQGEVNFLTGLFRKGRSNGTSSGDSKNTKSEVIKTKQMKTKKNSSSGRSRQTQRHVYFVGESFGGILASNVALTFFQNTKNNGKNKIQSMPSGFSLRGLILINAATCYDRSQLASKGPPVSNLPKLLYPFGLIGRLLPLFGDEYSFDQLILILQAKALPSVIDTPEREAYMGRVAFSLPTKLQYMSQDTLKWRLEQWLEVGCTQMGYKLNEFKNAAIPLMSTSSNKSGNRRSTKIPSWFRTLIVAGEKDLTLPSIAEAERLANKLPRSHVHVVEGAGHASTCGSRIDLAAEIRSHFPDILLPSKKQRKKQNDQNNKTDNKNRNVPMDDIDASTTTSTTIDGEGGRTSMKPIAAQGKGVMLGLEPRYDGADIGLNPIFYWSKKYYRKVDKPRAKRLNGDVNGIQ